MSSRAQTRQPASPSQALAPGLYVVSTPIGNLRDITLRALDVLGAADVVLAEDTRTSRILLDAHGVQATLTAYHEHNAAMVRPGLVARLVEGAVMALISDAGTPLVSDPGYKLVQDALAAGVTVHPIPGASAPLAALVAAGLPTDRFLFAGFLPQKPQARRAALEALASVPATLVFFEAGSRVAASVADMAAILGPRPAALARELTKAFEEVRRAPLDELAAQLAAEGAPKGELVLLAGPPDAAPWDDARVDAALRDCLAQLSVKDAAAEVSQASGWARRDVYARALAVKQAQ